MRVLWVMLVLACSGGCGRIGFDGSSDAAGSGAHVATAVIVAGNYACALADGAVACWGENTVGELGNGTTASFGGLAFPDELSAGVTMITGAPSSGHYGHTCAVVNGAALCWGGNDSGEIGDGTTTGRPTPTQVTGLTSGVVEIAAGSNHTCALLNTGGVLCWGANMAGQVGDGTMTQRLMPTPVSGLATGVTAIAAGGGFSCALLGASGEVRCWGGNTQGELGDGTTTARPVPTTVSGLSSGATDISAGDGHACATVGGATRCWGYNISGQTGPTSNVPSCFVGNPCNTLPVTIPTLAGGVRTSIAGNEAACAILATGETSCWGRNSFGQLGDGTTNSTPTPVPVAGLMSGVTSIQIGYQSGCAIRDGALYCWGNNFYGTVCVGELYGPCADSLVPVLVQPWH